MIVVLHFHGIFIDGIAFTHQNLDPSFSAHQLQTVAVPINGAALGANSTQIIGECAASQVGLMWIDLHGPVNGAGCRLVAGIRLDQRGRAGGMAAVPAAHVRFFLGRRILLIAVLEREPSEIAAQAGAAVVHVFSNVGLILDGDRLVGCCDPGNGKVVICPGCDCYGCSVHFYRALHQRTALGQLVMERQAVAGIKGKAVRVEYDRPIGGGAGAGHAGRLSRLGQPGGLGDGHGVAAADAQAVEHAVSTGKQVCGIGNFFAARVARKEQLVVEGGLIGDLQWRRRVSLGRLTRVEFRAAEGQGRFSLL